MQAAIYTIVRGMKTFRIVVGVLAVLPFAMLVDVIFLHLIPYEIGEYLYLTIGVPILTLNFWAWEYPELIESFFFGKELSKT